MVRLTLLTVNWVIFNWNFKFFICLLNWNNASQTFIVPLCYWRLVGVQHWTQQFLFCMSIYYDVGIVYVKYCLGEVTLLPVSQPPCKSCGNRYMFGRVSEWKLRGLSYRLSKFGGQVPISLVVVPLLAYNFWNQHALILVLGAINTDTWFYYI